jgi:hypothetical protein
MLACAIFWDYENVRLPKWVHTCEVASLLRNTVQSSAERLGFRDHRIAERKVYYDSRKPSESTTDRQTLDSTGFTLVDCPARNKKETVDKKIIVDIMEFVRGAERESPTCVFLISSDCDYSYMISRLRDVSSNVHVVVVHQQTSSMLLASASLSLHFIDDVISPLQLQSTPEVGCDSDERDDDDDDKDDDKDGRQQEQRDTFDLCPFIARMSDWLASKENKRVSSCHLTEFWKRNPDLARSKHVRALPAFSSLLSPLSS